MIRKCSSAASLEKKINENGNLPKQNGIPRVQSKSSLEYKTSSQVAPGKSHERRGSVCMEDLPNDKLLKLEHKVSELSMKSENDDISTSDILSEQSDEIDVTTSDFGSLTTNDVADALGATDVEDDIFAIADSYQVPLFI